MRKPPKVTVTHRVFPETVTLLRSAADPVLNQTPDPLPPAEIVLRTRAATGMIAIIPDRIDEAFLDRCPRLRIVASATEGCDNVDIEACTRRGVWLTVVPDLLTVPTAELAIGLMIGLARHVREGDRRIRANGHHGWRPDLYGAGIAGRTIGIVGMGGVGRAIARRLGGFEARLVYTDPAPLPIEDEVTLRLARMPLYGLLATSDFVILAVPLTPATRHLIRDETMRRMKRGAYLINPSRGSVVDEMTIAMALVDGRLAGYAADVFEFEDGALADRPREIAPPLRAMPGETLFTPHLGSAVTEARRAIERAAVENVVAALSGTRPPGAVNELARAAPEPLAARA